MLQLDDESLALKLQIEEVEAQRERQTGKWAEGNPPDHALAFDNYEAELKTLATRVEDMKLAHSITYAMETDATAIEELRAQEKQSIEDRQVALSLNEGEALPHQDSNELLEMGGFAAESGQWDHVLRDIESSKSDMDCASTVAGPSTPHRLWRAQSSSHYSAFGLW
ncbi:hypothetical protein M7I_3420 [Glarea lozoyensis 74030]|uniref:Uncharacterized protein n=1 Tax=Glarea lozoyensis (strain ATCC 74030 / MF5533) TaxID=1104152 RepID=H0ELF7_GLAL7|nr:hypothetical protein M7I_3420 [Glarea lozoyensis 74030]